MCTIHRMLITYLTLCAGLRVAQVRVIFRLPAAVCVAAGLHTSCAGEPLAYIEWFTQFHARDNTNGMFLLTRSTRQHRRHAAIIPVTAVARSCHLIPVWGSSMDRSWTSEKVLDTAKKFYFNWYLRHNDFVEYRYVLTQERNFN